MKHHLIMILAASTLLLAACTERPPSITDLRCEYLRSPINIDATAPRFTWAYEGTSERGTIQAAYQVDVATSKAALEEEKPLWTSGKVEDTRSKEVYGGQERFLPHARYFWRVTAWDDRGQR